MLNLNLDLRYKKWLILGGGTVASRRVKKILDEGGEVQLISPEVTKIIAKLGSQNKRIKIVIRKFRKSDIKKQDFILACTNDAEVNKRIVSIAKQKKILVSNASDKEDNDFSFTSNININKDVKVNLSTNGKNPSLSKTLRVFIERKLKAEISSLSRIQNKKIKGKS